MAIPAITREDVFRAISDMDGGLLDPGEYGKSTVYDLVYEGRRYAPKAVVGFASRRVLGVPLPASEFSGGESAANKVLRRLGFQVVRKNPDWTRDEYILALDTFIREGRDGLAETHPAALELSELLRRLPIHDDRSETFRSPSAVTTTLAGFYYLQQGDRKIELSAVGREVYGEFGQDPDRLHLLAGAIRRAVDTGEADLSVPQPGEEEAPEGRLLHRTHVARERNARLVREKKRQILENTGRLACEICDFCFQEAYGDLGEDFIEAHHQIPVASMTPDHKTKLSDLRLVCANCHRMIHTKGLHTVEQMRALVRHPAQVD